MRLRQTPEPSPHLELQACTQAQDVMYTQLGYSSTY